jgi:WD40 repeat protein
VDATMKFIDVARKEVTKVFTGHQGSTRIGINSFRWSSVGKYLVSGADRTLLFWDPFTLEIMNRNDGLRSPIIGLEVCDPLQKVFAALSNKTILVWHNITLELLQSINDNTIYKPTNVLSSMVFVPEKNMMYSAGNRISAWTLEK